MTVVSPHNHAVVSGAALTKVYRRGGEEVRALDGVSFAIGRGEFVAIVGPSGAGKTTLLQLIGCMDAPSSGTLHLAGRAIHELTEWERTKARREQIGFVFQHFSLLPTLTVAENVALPALFARREAAARVDELLEKVGLWHRRTHRPHELSGGEMQRAALARALINQPQILLADEPTGNLDSATGETVIALFRKLHAEGVSLVVVTHNAALAAAAQRQIELRDGRIAGCRFCRR
ncbi:MAG: ABC transporter ATP-binding protein [Verrucomicrobia bacterium]|nr:ABC transporter ATP-binding protein [Verrucomicrobiota bacterium]